MKEIIARKVVQGQNLNAVYRFIGKKIYIRFENLQNAAAIVSQIERQGGKVIRGRNWLECDLFGGRTCAKFGEDEIDLEKQTEEEVETILVNFFLKTLKNMGFELKFEEIN